ncbi:hypothetical protein PR048_012054, partial [Dryococelus australis]
MTMWGQLITGQRDLGKIRSGGNRNLTEVRGLQQRTAFNPRFGRLLTLRPAEPMKGDPGEYGVNRREKREISQVSPLTNGIVRHDYHMRRSGVTGQGIEPGSPPWEASRLTAQPPKTCAKCGKKKHFESICRSKVAVNVVDEACDADPSDHLLLEEYRDVLGLGKFPFSHHITLKLDAEPVIRPACGIPIKLKDWLNTTLDHSNSPLRICLEPKFLIIAIERERLYIPNQEDINNTLQGKQFYFVVDMQESFYHKSKAKQKRFYDKKAVKKRGKEMQPDEEVMVKEGSVWHRKVMLGPADVPRSFPVRDESGRVLNRNSKYVRPATTSSTQQEATSCWLKTEENYKTSDKTKLKKKKYGHVFGDCINVFAMVYVYNSLNDQETYSPERIQIRKRHRKLCDEPLALVMTFPAQCLRGFSRARVTLQCNRFCAETVPPSLFHLLRNITPLIARLESNYQAIARANYSTASRLQLLVQRTLRSKKCACFAYRRLLNVWVRAQTYYGEVERSLERLKTNSSRQGRLLLNTGQYYGGYTANEVFVVEKLHQQDVQRWERAALRHRLRLVISL